MWIQWLMAISWYRILGCWMWRKRCTWCLCQGIPISRLDTRAASKKDIRKKVQWYHIKKKLFIFIFIYIYNYSYPIFIYNGSIYRNCAFSWMFLSTSYIHSIHVPLMFTGFMFHMFIPFIVHSTFPIKHLPLHLQYLALYTRRILEFISSKIFKMTM